ncbi:hypothetical protein EJ04DRAFT_112876 [Polyplosphaeria fusca]|uniref:Uncharacterized protein n=1 Tax=Polyplosphaeria fusca TaxID=682080 RepID=A0A9P4RCH5_9PLEO|nr:hypothetical protein EJ04DRAFT_112876 [Polyplosphaeria fusca]
MIGPILRLRCLPPSVFRSRCTASHESQTSHVVSSQKAAPFLIRHCSHKGVTVTVQSFIYWHGSFRRPVGILFFAVTDSLGTNVTSAPAPQLETPTRSMRPPAAQPHSTQPINYSPSSPTSFLDSILNTELTVLMRFMVLGP